MFVHYITTLTLPEQFDMFTMHHFSSVDMITEQRVMKYVAQPTGLGIETAISRITICLLRQKLKVTTCIDYSVRTFTIKLDNLLRKIHCMDKNS